MDRRLAHLASQFDHSPPVIDMNHEIESMAEHTAMEIMTDAIDGRKNPCVVGIYKDSAYLWDGCPPVLSIRHAKALGTIKSADIFVENAPNPEDTPDYDFVYTQSTLNIEPHDGHPRHASMLEHLISELFGDLGKGHLMFDFDERLIVSGHVIMEDGSPVVSTLGFVDPEILPHAKEAIEAYFRDKDEEEQSEEDNSEQGEREGSPDGASNSSEQ